MLKFSKLRAAACAVAVLSAPASQAAELSDTGEFLDGVAAIVNEGVVLKSQLREQTALIIERASRADPPIQLPPANILREQLLERLILKEIQLQRAEMIGLQVSDQMVNDAIGRIAQQNGVPFEQMPALLAEDGISYAAFRRDLREEMTDYNLSHITISIPESASPDEVAAAKAEADDVYRQLLEGVDFRELALRHSDAQTALEGGGLGWMKGEQLPTLYTDVVINLEAGEVSEPFRTAGSFHIVKVNDMRSALQRSEIDQVKVRHILITPNEIIDDQTAKQQLDDARERIANGEDFGEIAKLLSDDPGSASLGGELEWSGRGTYAPEFEQMIAQSETGELSEPFRTMFGWHILEVMDRRVYDNTEDLKESRCIQRVREGKMADETELWLRRIRDEAFVDMRS